MKSNNEQVKFREILREIENLKSELKSIANTTENINDPEVLEKSKELDEKLNIYNRMLINGAHV